MPHGGIVLSLGRLSHIRAIDPLSASITVEAGVLLAEAQAAADQEGMLFPCHCPRRARARSAATSATNAGGTGVLAYGNMRDLVLGLEVVLADGRVWNGLSALRKDNAGYDLKHLFVGSEGTLGIITAAVLKLYPKPSSRTVGLRVFRRRIPLWPCSTRLNGPLAITLRHSSTFRASDSKSY